MYNRNKPHKTLLILCVAMLLAATLLEAAAQERTAESWYKAGLRECQSPEPNLIKARQALDKALDINPHISAYAYKWRSWVKRRQGELASALEDISTAITLQPKDARLYAFRADLRRQMADVQGAITDYGIALQLAESSPDASVYRELRDSCIIEQAGDSLAQQTPMHKKNK